MTDPIPVPDPVPDDSERSGFKELLRLGVPLVAGMGGHALFNIVDLAMVGTDFLALMSFHAWSGFLLMQVTANMRAVGMSFWTMVLMLGSNVGNILLNWVLVFGHWGFEDQGPIGSAWATVFARGAACVAG